MILLELHPSETLPGVRFNVQPDGRAALAVRCRDATPGMEIVFAGVGLPTVFVTSELLTAFVPSELFSQPGVVQVYVRDGRNASNGLPFVVRPEIDQQDRVPSDQPAVHRDTTAGEPSLLLLVLHFGSWPEWLPFFLETCRWNSTVDWLLITDCETPAGLPANVRVHRDSLAGIRQRTAEKLGFDVPIDFAYKLCDLRLAFAQIFDDLTAGYDFIGWSDLDVVYGNLRHVLSRDALANDVITFYQEHLSGHLTLVRNSPAMRELYLQVPAWSSRVTSPQYRRLDEPDPALIRPRFSVWAEQSYNTPLSPYVPWRDGTFNFPAEWYWQAGRLTTDVDGEHEFLYLHFMHWKGGPWPRACGNAHWERLSRIVHSDPVRASEGFCVSAHGFSNLQPNASTTHAGLGTGRARRPGAVVLMYHRLAQPDVDPWSLAVSPHRFAEQLEWLRDAGYRFIALKELERRLNDGTPIDNCAVVTFDDGYADNLSAVPILERHDTPATLFVTAGYTGGSRRFWWDALNDVLLAERLPASLSLTIDGRLERVDLGDETTRPIADRSWRAGDGANSARQRLYCRACEALRPLPFAAREHALSLLLSDARLTPRLVDSQRQMTADEIATVARNPLIDIGSHTLTHPDLTQLTIADQRVELSESRKMLEELAGTAVTTFAYPHGLMNADTAVLANEVGYTSACSTDKARVGAGAYRFRLARFMVEDWDADEFGRRLSALMSESSLSREHQPASPREP